MEAETKALITFDYFGNNLIITLAVYDDYMQNKASIIRLFGSRALEAAIV